MGLTQSRYGFIAMLCGAAMFGQISGRVTLRAVGADGQAAAGAVLELVPSGGTQPVARLTANSSGEIDFHHVLPGHYELRTSDDRVVVSNLRVFAAQQTNAGTVALQAHGTNTGNVVPRGAEIS